MQAEIARRSLHRIVGQRLSVHFAMQAPHLIFARARRHFEGTKGVLLLNLIFLRLAGPILHSTLCLTCEIFLKRLGRRSHHHRSDSRILQCCGTSLNVSPTLRLTRSTPTCCHHCFEAVSTPKAQIYHQQAALPHSNRKIVTNIII